MVCRHVLPGNPQEEAGSLSSTVQKSRHHGDERLLIPSDQEFLPARSVTTLDRNGAGAHRESSGDRPFDGGVGLPLGRSGSDADGEHTVESPLDGIMTAPGTHMHDQLDSVVDPTNRQRRILVSSHAAP